MLFQMRSMVQMYGSVAYCITVESVKQGQKPHAGMLEKVTRLDIQMLVGFAKLHVLKCSR
jgi:hypothetical protein